MVRNRWCVYRPRQRVSFARCTWEFTGKALREIRTVVGYVLDDLAAEGEPIPVPLGKRSFSGKLNLRMPKDLHRKLALESEIQGVSLNSLINSKLER